MNTLIISSSLSPESRSFILCTNVVSTLKKKGVKVTFVDARDLELLPHHRGPTKDMKSLARKVKAADNIIIGMGVHLYSVNDSLKIILDSCFDDAEGKFFGVLCAAGGEKSYLASMHLSQMCMKEWRMMQLPRVLFASGKDFDGDHICSNDVFKRVEQFCEEFKTVGEKLLK